MYIQFDHEWTVMICQTHLFGDCLFTYFRAHNCEVYTDQTDTIIRIFILFLWQYIIVTYTNTDVHLQFYKIVLIIVISTSNGHFNSWSILYWLKWGHFIALTMFLCGNRLQINSIAHVLKNKEVRPRKAFNLGDLDFTTVFFFFFALAGG